MDETEFKLLEQKVRNVECTLAASLNQLSLSMDLTRKELSDQLTDLRKSVINSYVSKDALAVHLAQGTARIDSLEREIGPIKKIVYGAISFILVAVLGGLIALVVR